MFTVEQRDALRERVLRLAEEDDRVEARAAVGSLAVDEGDRFSDLDLTFAVTDYVAVADVLDEWTTTLVDELGAVRSRPRSDHLPSVPAAGRASVRPFAHAGESVSSRWTEVVVAVQARGYDALPSDTLAGFDATLPGSVERHALRAALAASVRALLHEGAEADLAHAGALAERLSELH